MSEKRLQKIKEYWLAPIFMEFEYHQKRDHTNDIEWLISEVERLQAEKENENNMVWKLSDTIIKLRQKLQEYDQWFEEASMNVQSLQQKVEAFENKQRYLIVIENKKSGERFLYNPFKHEKVCPDGYYKVTQQVPLDESKYGSLPILETMGSV